MQHKNAQVKARLRPVTILLGLIGICSLAYVALVITPAAVEKTALQPLASRLKTSSSKTAIVAHVTDALEDHKGASQKEIHILLDSIGAFTYRGPYPSGNGETVENAYWTLAELPVGKIWAVWVLRYDNAGRLIEVEIGDS